MSVETPIYWEHVAKFNEAIFKGERRMTQRAITRAIAAETEVERLREALNLIIANQQFADPLMSDADIARAALEAKP